MCGLLGYFSNSNPVDREKFSQALLMLNHRGPESRNTWFYDNVALGHTRLKIIDLSDNATQPFMNTSGTIFAVVNGEFYGYKQIRQDLISKGYSFKSTCDSEILIYLYELYGIKAVDYLSGEWAFILYDSRNNTMHAARDPFGIKPLYYCKADDHVYFASEMKCFINLCHLELNDSLFNDINFMSNGTSFKNVYHVMPGCIQTINKDGMSSIQYYKLNLSNKNRKYQSHTEEFYKKELVNKLDDAVKLRLQADVPVGIYLSGGIDSTSMLALASRHLKKIHTFSIIFPDETVSDESYYINKSLEFYRNRGCDIVYHVVEYKHTKMLENLEKGIWFTETMNADELVGTQIELSKLVHDSGFKVVITGQGSDEVLGGYNNMIKDLGFKIKHQKNFPSLWHFISIKLLTNYFFCKWYIKKKLPYLPSIMQLYLYKSFYKEDVFRILDSIASQENWFLKDKFSLTQFIDMHRMFKAVLNIRGDRVEMANSVEGRLPFLDKEFVSFAESIPAHLKINNGREKYILYEAMRKDIPPEIYQRKKHGFMAQPKIRISEEAISYLKKLIAENTGKIRDPLFQQYLAKFIDSERINSLQFNWLVNAMLINKLFINC